MKDINGYLRKTIWIFSIIFSLCSLFPSKIFAQTSLSTDAVFSHNIKENSVIETTLTFTISSTDRTVLTYYTITIPQENVEPTIYSTNKKKPLEATVYNRTNSTDILIDFENSVIDSENPIKISLTYTQNYSDGNIINLTSKVADTITSKVSITYPKTWQETSWISDQIEDIKKTENSYILTISNPDSNSIKLIFGKNIIYKFDISKSLNNPTNINNQYEIILPPDTQFQKIIIEDVSIQPTQSIIDNNGNYILIFTLDAQTQKDVKISGYIIMENHEYYSKEISTHYDSSDIYWGLETKQIEKVKEYLEKKGVSETSDNSVLSRYLYDYVIETLKPSTSATTLSGGVRRGAIDILKSPNESTPEDYTDLLRALLTYYEIPTIYTIGYVSDISSYQENGMFHYWLQSYFNDKWNILDPYLEDFSKVSLFNREQLDHITILNRVHDSISPILTYYSDNDISFEYLIDSEVVYNPQSNISISLEPYSILNKYIYGKISVENTGNTIFTGIQLTESQPDLNKYIDNVTNSTNNILLPHMKKDIDLHIPFNSLTEEMIFSTVQIKNGTKSIDSELISTEYSISEHTGYEIITKVISILLFVIIFSIIYIVVNKFVYKK